MRFIAVAYLFFSGALIAQEILPYTSILQHRTPEKWTAANQRTFDEQGVTLEKGKYHPLNIAQYGVYNYHLFQETGDSAYYQACSNQFNYFRDTSKVHSLFDGEAIGLPYDYNFHDLTAPWYSGMTQGYSASYLIRYYDLTRDRDALSILQKVVKMMLIPEGLGGTLGTTPEGLTWIEEYPNSSKEAVLNGFINGFIGLYEYCTFFPQDTLAGRIKTECYDALKKSIPLYDKPTWTSYDRKGGQVSNQYMKYEIIEMKHLYELTNDIQFKHQMMLWSTFAFNKTITHQETGFKNLTYNFSVPVKAEYDYWVPNILYPNLITPGSLDTIITEPAFDNVLTELVFTSIASTSLLDTTVSKKGKRKYAFDVQLNDTCSIDIIQLLCVDGFNLGAEYDLYYYNLDKEKLKKMKDFAVTGSETVNTLTFEEPVKSNEIKLCIELDNSGQRLELNAVAFYDSNDPDLPWYAHRLSDPIYVQSSEFGVSIPLLEANYALTFYRYAKDEGQLASTNWTTANSFTGNAATLTSNPGYYQFLTVFELNGAHSKIGDVLITE